MARNKPILIFGDSFSADWGKDTRTSWVDIITEKYNVINIAQAGVGEYKIYLQLKSLNLNNFSYIIGNHTSHSRVHSRLSIHNTEMHSNCDLMYSDSMHLKEARWYFENVYDDAYHKFTYELIRNKIDTMLERYDKFIFDPFYSKYKNVYSFVGKWKFDAKNKNHFDTKTNIEIAELIKNKISYDKDSSRES